MVNFNTSFNTQVHCKDVLTELQVRLDAAPFDTSRVKASLKNDVLRLTGVVPDEAAKRDAKALAHSIEGVIYVENALKIEDSPDAKTGSGSQQMGANLVDNLQMTNLLFEEKRERLWPVTELFGYTVRAKDGETGKVHDFYFDDTTWAIRYLVVDLGDWLLDTGEWIPGQKVLVSVRACGLPHRETQMLPLTPLSRKQIELSPNIEMYKTLLDNPPLCSAKEVLGYRIQALDGDMGQVKNFFIDTKSWFVSLVVISTQKWWPFKKAAVTPLWIDQVHLADSTVDVNLPQEFIKSRLKFESKAVQA